MTKFSPEYLCLADELLSQYALTQDDQLSGILTKENLEGEVALFRQLVGQLKAGDVFLGDAIFENYFLLALLQAGGIDAVCEKNGARHVDFRQCDQKLGKKDGLIRLTKPARPEWMSHEYYNQSVPDELTIKVIKSKKTHYRHYATGC